MTKKLIVLIMFSFFKISAQNFCPQNNPIFGKLFSGSATFADINGDAKPDLIQNGQDNSGQYFIKAFTNSGTNFNEIITPLSPTCYGAIKVFDFNKDGFMDIFIAGEDETNSSVGILYTNSGVSFSEAARIPSSGMHQMLCEVADVNSDGYPDVFISKLENNNIDVILHLYTFNGTNFEVVNNTPFTSSFDGNLGLADVNGDNKIDVLISGIEFYSNNTYSRNTFLYTNSGANFSKVTSSTFTGVNYGSISFGDVNGDNKIDLLLTGYIGGNNSIAKLYTNSGNNFKEVLTTPFPDVSEGVSIIRDLNNDSKPDILLSGFSGFSPVLLLYTNSGSNFDLANISSFVGLGNTAIALADIDGNSTVDFFVQGTDYLGSARTQLYKNLPFTKIVTQPQNKTIDLGNTVYIFVSATGNNLSYQWNNGSSVSGFNSSLAGNFMVTVSGGCNSVSSNQVSLKYNLTVKGFDLSRVYGQNSTASGTLLGMSLSYPVTAQFNTSATSLSGIGNYSIIGIVTGSNATNYSVVNQIATLSITAASLSVIGFNYSRKFGEINPAFSGTMLGIANNDILNLIGNTTANTYSNIGIYPIAISVTGTKLSNYITKIFNPTLTITKAVFSTTLTSPISIGSSIYNGLPIVPSIIGLHSGTNVNYLYNGSPNSIRSVGIHTIVGIINDNNFELATITGEVKLNKAPLTINCSNTSREYGVPNYPFSGNVIGIVNNDTVVTTLATPANINSGIGVYSISGIASGTNINNYEISVKTCQLNIYRKNANIIVNNIYKTYSDPITTFSGKLNGFIEDDVININYVLSSTSSRLNVGTYEIIPIISENAILNNYNIYTYPGILRIDKADLSIKVNNSTKIYGEENPQFTSSITGLAEGDLINVNYTTSANAFSNVGSYSVFPVVTGSSLENYYLKTISGQLIITKTLSIDDDTSYDINIYPNPSEGAFNIVLTDVIPVEYTIFTMLGNELEHGRFSGQKQVFIATKGLYIIEMQQGQRKLRRKIVVQ